MSLLVSLPLLAAGACAPAAQDAPAEAAARLAIEWSVPGLWLTGAEFSATVRIEAPEAGLALPVWALGPAAFEVGGEPLGERSGDGVLQLQPGQVLDTTIALGAVLDARSPEGAFELACGLPRRVRGTHGDLPGRRRGRPRPWRWTRRRSRSSRWS